jgi:hypothetical protein
MSFNFKAMKIFKFASIGFLIGFLISQFTFKASAQDDEKTRAFKVDNFSKISLDGGYKVFLKQGEKTALKVKVSDEDAFDYIDVSSDFSELKVSMKRNYINFDRLTLYITVAELKELRIQGGVKLETTGYIEADDLDVKVEGGAKIEMKVKIGDLKVVGEGGVLFDFEGVANNLDARVSGAGHVDASDLKAKTVTFDIEGVGTGSVYATDELWAHIQGVGKIKYSGQPKVHKTIEGIGTISDD